MDYKKIIKSRQSRTKILSKLSWVPDSIMLRIQYRLKMGFWPDFKHPKRLSEKLQLYKMHYRNPSMPRCVDKYDVREYVKGKGLDSILNRLYGVYDDVSEIQFDTLPHRFIMKSTTGGGGFNVLVVKDKNAIDWDDVKQKIAPWCWKRTRQQKTNSGREWAYLGIKQSRIIIEELLEDDNNPDGSIDDYKFFCFNGEPRLLYISRGLEDHSTARISFVSLDWTPAPFRRSDYTPFETLPEKPAGLDKMMQYSRILAEGTYFVRVDFYEAGGEVYFSEMTFYPTGGYLTFGSDEEDLTLGGWLKLPTDK